MQADYHNRIDCLWVTAAGEASQVVGDMRCNTFRNSTHIITDTPMRNVCQNYWHIKKIMVTPYVPNPLEERNPRAYLHLPYRPLADRQTLVSNAF